MGDSSSRILSVPDQPFAGPFRFRRALLNISDLSNKLFLYS
jgi:hypothetical protein